MNVIIYPIPGLNGRVAVMTVAPEFSDAMEVIAAKDVPYQLEWVADDSPDGGHWVETEQAVWRIIDDADLPPYDQIELWRWTASGPLDVAAPPPQPAPVPASITFAQLLIGLVTEAWITEADGNGWLTGTLPASVTAVIDGLPEGQRFAAKARALRPSEVMRADPLVAAMGTAAGKTSAEIDTFFQTYAGV